MRAHTMPHTRKYIRAAAGLIKVVSQVRIGVDVVCEILPTGSPQGAALQRTAGSSWRVRVYLDAVLLRTGSR